MVEGKVKTTDAIAQIIELEVIVKARTICSGFFVYFCLAHILYTSSGHDHLILCQGSTGYILKAVHLRSCSDVRKRPWHFIIKNMDQSTRALIAQWIDSTFIQTKEWPTDSITTTDIQNGMQEAGKGVVSVAELNEFLSSLDIVGQNIKGYSDRIWKLAYR